MENSHIYAILTKDNLLDGTIETNSEHFYIEPSHRYSSILNDSGIHSIIYRLSDVDMRKASASTTSALPRQNIAREDGALSYQEHCASERLRHTNQLDKTEHHKLNTDDNWKIRKNNQIPVKPNSRMQNSSLPQLHRFKRWLPDEVNISSLYIVVSQTILYIYIN